MLTEEDDAMDDLAAGPALDQYDNDLFDDQGSISTLNETLNIKTRSRITDFAMLYWLESDFVNPDKDDNKDESFLIEHEFIPVLIEVKWSASRQLTGEELLHDQTNLMHRAKEAVFRQVIYLNLSSSFINAFLIQQALYLFANCRWCHQKSVLVIAAMEDIWTYTCVS